MLSTELSLPMSCGACAHAYIHIQCSLNEPICQARIAMKASIAMKFCNALHVSLSGGNFDLVKIGCLDEGLYQHMVPAPCCVSGEKPCTSADSQFLSMMQTSLISSTLHCIQQSWCDQFAKMLPFHGIILRMCLVISPSYEIAKTE